MGIIHVLDTDVSNKIAAGEVVERPHSIVKELVENSIDAGATSITVELKNGGISYIRVTDNGCGMSEEDAKICFLRHATSKVLTSKDLEAIMTLGFRGEALSSIGAVSKMKLYTKRKEDGQGVCVTCNGGEIVSSSAAGIPNGTIVEVTDLFYNTPARFKFLKKPSTESSYVSDMFSRSLLAHPDISFKLIKDGKEAMFSSGDNSLINAVYAVYGKDYAKNMREVDYEFNGVHVIGAIGTPTAFRSNRNRESFFVNKRYIKSATLIRALEEAYKNQLLPSRFPVAVLNIEIDPTLIDINVHPTKLECKFSNEQDIYQAVYHAVKSTLYAIPNIPEIAPEIAARQNRPSIEDIFEQRIQESKNWKGLISKVPQRDMSEPIEPRKEMLRSIPPKSEGAFATLPKPENKVPKDEAKQQIDTFAMLDYALKRGKSDQSKLSARDPSAYDMSRQYEKIKRYAEQINGQNDIKNTFDDGYFSVIGQIFDTYIIIQKDDKMLLIDQHAAHERLNYESLKADMQERGVTSQMMLIPVDVQLNESEFDVYNDHIQLFNDLGFEIDIKKDCMLSITSVPSDISYSDTEPLFFELLTAVADMKQDIIAAEKERLLYTISCKAAIKANMKISVEEMKQLAEKVFKLKNINTCPHGRPIVIEMTKKELEKAFDRIV